MGGERFEVRWRPGPGEPEPSRSFPTITAAKVWRTQVDAARMHGQRLHPRAGKRLFGDYADEWLEGRRLADRTRELYVQLHASHIKPRCSRLVRSIFASTVEDGLVPTNPCTIKGAGVEDSSSARSPRPSSSSSWPRWLTQGCGRRSSSPGSAGCASAS